MNRKHDICVQQNLHSESKIEIPTVSRRDVLDATSLAYRLIFGVFMSQFDLFRCIFFRVGGFSGQLHFLRMPLRSSNWIFQHIYTHRFFAALILNF